MPAYAMALAGKSNSLLFLTKVSAILYGIPKQMTIGPSPMIPGKK